MTKISNCGHDERGRYSGGKPGDQGGEYQIVNYYKRPWKCVLRYPNKAVADAIADISTKAALNQNIGYCQAHRRTYCEALKAANWDPSKITKPVEGDCSSTTAANVIAAGYRTGKVTLQKINPDATTRNMRAAFKAAGFTVLTSIKYTDSSDYLLPGDILLNDDVHVAVNVTAGTRSAAEGAASPSSGSSSSAPAAAIDNAPTIWSFLKGKGFSDVATAGIMGNLYAESALIPTNLQNSFEKKIGLNDAQYTAAVDNGTYKNFDRDGAGYGLAQWTYWTRKQQLRKLAAEKKASVGNLNVQLEYLYTEITVNYSGVSAALKTAKTVREASDVFLKQFERPADQSEAVMQKRAGYGQLYFDKYGGKTTAGPTFTVGKIYTTAVALNVRAGAGTNYRKKAKAELTADGQRHSNANGTMNAGTNVSCLQVSNVGSDIWIRTPSGWLAAYYHGETYIK